MEIKQTKGFIVAGQLGCFNLRCKNVMMTVIIIMAEAKRRNAFSLQLIKMSLNQLVCGTKVAAASSLLSCVCSYFSRSSVRTAKINSINSYQITRHDNLNSMNSQPKERRKPKQCETRVFDIVGPETATKRNK